MQEKLTILLFVVILAWLAGLKGSTVDECALLPGQINGSMAGTVVRVTGVVDRLIENPGGLGGIYMIITKAGEEIDARIQPGVWDYYSEEEKYLYREGNVVILEGILFLAGDTLVVVHEKYEMSAN